MKHLLVVEDNPADAELVRESLTETGRTFELAIVQNGEDALAYVRRQGRFAAAARPDLILLDLNLPKVDGRQVLKELKEDPVLRVIPIVVLTSSDAAADVQQAYAMHANSYVKKYLDLDEFMHAIRAVEAFWLGVAELP